MTNKTKTDHKRVLDLLAELGGGVMNESGIRFEGSSAIVPVVYEGRLKDFASYLAKVIEDQDTQTRFLKTFDYRPWDGAYAVSNVIRRNYGMSTGVAIETFWGTAPPSMLSLRVGPSQEVQVPWGRITLPFLPDADSVDLTATKHPEKGPLFCINIVAPKRYAKAVNGFFIQIEEELKTNSLYRGKAIDGQTMPDFLDLSAVDESKVVYSAELRGQLEANLWSLLRYTDEQRAAGLSLKRSVLLTGKYGGGKSVTALTSAKTSVDHGWTFICVRPGRDDLEQSLQTAKLYQPAVVFFEDMDTISDPKHVDGDAVTRLLDVFDGIQSKGTEIVVVLTTNHPERIHRGMLRPGRLDSVIHLGELDVAGVLKMIEVNVPSDLLSADLDGEAIFTSVHGYMPAFVKEVIDRAKRYSMARNQGKVGVLETQDFVAAAHGLRPQFELMEGNPEHNGRITIEQLTEHLVEKTVRENIDPQLLVSKS